MKHCITETLNHFAKEIEKHCQRFIGMPGNPGSNDPAHWLAYYEAKIAAYEELCYKIPQVKQIPDFWRWVQSSEAIDWVPWAEREIKKITNTAECSCGVKLEWPQKCCDKCRKEKKIKAKVAKKSRKALKKRVKAFSRAKKGITK